MLITITQKGKSAGNNQHRERYFCLIHNDKRILFVSIHHRNLRVLALELFKVCHKMLHGIVSYIFISELTEALPSFSKTTSFSKSWLWNIFFAILDQYQANFESPSQFSITSSKLLGKELNQLLINCIFAVIKCNSVYL